MTAKILMFDIETAPMKADVWGMWKQNVGLNQLNSDWYVLCWAAKWLGEDEVFYSSLNDTEGYEPYSEDDEALITPLWELLDQADVVIGHNGRRFDVPKMNARFIKYGMPPPSTFKVVDTLDIAKRQFKFSSNRLDYLGQFLGVGGKMPHQGHGLWTGCIEGDKACWKTMIEYNIRDIALLEDVYLKLRPWAPTHPNMALWMEDDGEMKCPKCGSTKHKKKGFAYTSVGKYQRHVCHDCGGNFRDRVNTYNRKGMGVNAL